MATAIIYVFQEPRNWKNKAAAIVPVQYGGQITELENQVITLIARPEVYHVTVYNTYGVLILEMLKSQKTKGKNYGRENRKQDQPGTDGKPE